MTKFAPLLPPAADFSQNPAFTQQAGVPTAGYVKGSTSIPDRTSSILRILCVCPSDPQESSPIFLLYLWPRSVVLTLSFEAAGEHRPDAQ